MPDDEQKPDEKNPRRAGGTSGSGDKVDEPDAGAEATRTSSAPRPSPRASDASARRPTSIASPTKRRRSSSSARRPRRRRASRPRPPSAWRRSARRRSSAPRRSARSLPTPTRSSSAPPAPASWIKEHRQTFGALRGRRGPGRCGLRAAGRTGRTSTTARPRRSSRRPSRTSTGTCRDKDDDDDDDTKPTQLYPTFKSAAARRDAAIAKYREVESKYPGTGAAILAQLAEAGLLLDAGDSKGAAAAYEDGQELAARPGRRRGPRARPRGHRLRRRAARPDRRRATRTRTWTTRSPSSRSSSTSTMNGFKELGPLPPGARAAGQGRQGQGHRAPEGRAEARERSGRRRTRSRISSSSSKTACASSIPRRCLPRRPSDGRARRAGRGGGAAGPGGLDMNDPQVQKLIEQLKQQQGRRRAARNAARRSRVRAARAHRRRWPARRDAPSEAPSDGALARAVLARARGSSSGCGTLDTGNDRVNPETPLWLHRPSGAMHVVFTRPLTADSRTVGEPYERGRARDRRRTRARLRRHERPRPLRAAREQRQHDLALRDARRRPVRAALRRGARRRLLRLERRRALRGARARRRARRGATTAARRSRAGPCWAGEIAVTSPTPPTTSSPSTVAAGKALWHVAPHARAGHGGQRLRGPGARPRDGLLRVLRRARGRLRRARRRASSWTPVDLSAEAEQSQGGDALRYLDVDTTPVPDDLGAAGRVVFVASYAGGVYALDEDARRDGLEGREGPRRDRPRAVARAGRTRRARAAPTTSPGRPSGPEPRDPARVERRERSVGARAGDRTDVVAHPDSRGRSHGAGAAGGRAARRHDQLRRVLAFAARRQAHRRLRPRLRLLAGARGLRQPGLRGQQRRNASWAFKWSRRPRSRAAASCPW